MNREISILIQLRKNIVQEFGEQISTSTDCDILALLLKQKLNANISGQTLRRFFGLVKCNSKTSHFTLD